MERKRIITRVIPSEIIIYDILTRVPTESLVRFRCVCKDWSNLFFRNQLFVNLHFQNCNKSTSSGLIDTNKDHCLVFIDPNAKTKKRLMPITVGYDSSDVYIKDSLHGLLILGCYWFKSKDFRPTYYVYNPISNCSITIPKPIKGDDYYNFRLCYDPITEKYKVVDVCESDLTILKIKFFTLTHGLGDISYEDDYSWRDIVVPTPGRYNSYRPLQHIYLNGSLYFDIETWASRPVTDDPRCREFYVEPGPVKPYILGLDTNRECSYKIKLPSEVSTSAFDLKNLHDMGGGSLCLSQYFRATYELKIWTLKRKDHEDESEWMETFKIDMRLGNAYIELFNVIRVIGILTFPKLKFIIMNTDPYDVSTYFSYDMQSQHLEIIHGPTEYSNFHWHVNNIAIGKVQTSGPS